MVILHFICSFPISFVILHLFVILHYLHFRFIILQFHEILHRHVKFWTSIFQNDFAIFELHILNYSFLYLFSNFMNFPIFLYQYIFSLQQKIGNFICISKKRKNNIIAIFNWIYNYFFTIYLSATPQDISV